MSAKKRKSASVAYDAAELQFAYELRETSRLLLSGLKERIDAQGITLTQYHLLRHIWDDEGINQSELSERLATTQPATVATVDSLEERGLLKRVRGTEDRRKMFIFLTEKGSALRKVLLRHAYELSVEALDGLVPRDVATLRVLLDRIRKNLGNAGMARAAERRQA